MVAILETWVILKLPPFPSSRRFVYKVHYTFHISVERDGNIFSMFFVVLTIVFLEAGLIMNSPLERFVEALFWTTLDTYTLYEQ